MARAFIIRPFGRKTDSNGKEIDFDSIDADLITPALEAAGLEGGTTGELVDAGNIREDMFSLILEAHLIVCDVTVHNANVFYELGIRHALRKRHTVMIRGEPTGDKAPFDLSTDRYMVYPINDPAAARERLTAMMTATLLTDRPTDSPVFQLLPLLGETDATQAKGMPVDFVEEVQRAQASHAVGWLRLLSKEVSSQRFARAGLALVARAQWDLGDVEGALETWKQVLSQNSDDVEANLAMANVYERRYRDTEDEQFLAASNQAVDRVLNNREAPRSHRTEASTLRGRNQKSVCRLGFARAQTLEERRARALDAPLLKSFESYRDAFLDDLNHFYPGVNALSAATMLIDLAERGDWASLFESDEQAQTKLAELKRSTESLRQVVPLSVNAALRRLDESDPERMWAAISSADIAFMSDSPSEKRVLTAYRNAIPLDKPFGWVAARGQLELFSQLGIRQPLADAVIAAMDQRFPAKKPAADAKPLHVVVFAGHTVDAPSRAQPRFPAALVPAARQRINETFTELNDGSHDLLVLASAAPGADILAHEVCSGLKLNSVVCLPMPSEPYVQWAFVDFDDWRSRYFDLIDGRKLDQGLLVLSQERGLPRWLQASGVDPWERGNHWVNQLALTWGAQRLSLVALWDGKPTGDRPGGTAHMVRLARESGRMRVMTIDIASLGAA
jgi:hypothetical protein